MDQSALVGNQVAEGRRFVERFAADGNRIRAAFWVKTADEGLWFLYVATDLAEQSGPAAANRAVRDSIQKLGDPEISSSEIKVVGPNHPIARDVLKKLEHQPDRTALRLSNNTLGSSFFEESYIYPNHFFNFKQASPMTTDDIGQVIFRLMNQGPGLRQASYVELKDGTTFDGVPFSIQLGTHNAMIVQFVEEAETAPRVVPIDEIASILRV